MRSLLFLCALFFTISLTAVPQYIWNTGAWSDCSAVCEGMQTRSVQCWDNYNSIVVTDSFCNSSTKPATEQPCGAACTYSWVAGEWGECSEICGPGFQSRSVQCTKVETSEAVSESYCDSPSMPALTQPCDLGVCIDEDIVDEDAVDEDLVDEDFINCEGGGDIPDTDEIFTDEDNADNETVIDEIAVNDDQTGDEDQTTDEVIGFDEDTAVNDDTVNDETADSALSDEDSGEVDNENSEEDDDSGCGCNVIGL